MVEDGEALVGEGGAVPFAKMSEDAVEGQKRVGRAEDVDAGLS